MYKAGFPQSEFCLLTRTIFLQFVCIPQSEYYRILSQGEENIHELTENGEVVVVTEYRSLDGGNRHGYVVIKVREMTKLLVHFWVRLIMPLTV
jgi:Rap guanine nucleotide exchange factor 2